MFSQALSGSVLGPSGRIAEKQGFPMVFAAFRRCGKATLLQHLFVVYGPAVIRYFHLIWRHISLGAISYGSAPYAVRGAVVL